MHESVQIGQLLIIGCRPSLMIEATRIGGWQICGVPGGDRRARDVAGGVSVGQRLRTHYFSVGLDISPCGHGQNIRNESALKAEF